MVKTETVIITTDTIAPGNVVTINVPHSTPAGYEVLIVMPFCGNGWCVATIADANYSLHVHNMANTGERSFTVNVLLFVYIKK